MGLRTQIRRRRTDSRWVAATLAFLLFLFCSVFYYLLHSRDLDARLINNRVLLFALWYVNVVLILAILFPLLRIVFKVLVERKHRILGSKFKTKLIATYVGLSLFPVLLLFFFANQILQGSIERWFSVPLQEVVEKARNVAEDLNRRIEQDNLRLANRVLDELGEATAESIAGRPGVTDRLRALLEETAIDMVAVYEGTDFVQAVISSYSGLVDLPELEWNLLRQAAREGRAVKIRPLQRGEGRLMIAAVSRAVPAEDTSAADAPASVSPPAAEEDAIVVVVATVLEQPVAGEMQELVEAYLAHRQLVVQKEDIKSSQLLLFLMATLLILLASSWVGMYLARRITVPIQALAVGTRKIKSGDLEYRVDVDAGDELGVLVDSFNRMTGELQRSRALREETNAELLATSRQQEEERALIAAVLQSVGAGVISIDPQGRVFTCNRAARKLLRLREEILGRPIAELWRDSERSRLVELLERLPPEGRLSQQLGLVLGGAWKTFEVTVTPVRDPEGQILGRVMVLEDLTELMKAQKLAAWTEAARRIAHEIKNPLTPIKLAAERLLRKHRQDAENLGPTLEEGVEIIVREVGTMQTLVDEFSRYARMPTPQLAEVDLSRLVTDTLGLYRDIKPGVEVDGRVAAAADHILIDGEQIKRVLINLLDNAVEATEAPGSVSLEVERQNGLVRLKVADTGRGIPAEAKEKLFMPYFSTKGRGTGLGLAIVHRIVRDHHGRVRVEDNRPQGTVFTVELPAR